MERIQLNRFCFNKVLVGIFLIYHQGCQADFLESTKLIEIKQGSELSSKMELYRTGGYELSTGSPQNFKSWYSTPFTDSRVSFISQINRNFGVIWGFSTGEKAPKYLVEPSIKLGLVAQYEFDNKSFITIRGTTIIGGRLKESSCTADYGDIGGVQQVNCRLAATTLQPSQTLQYLHNEKPYNYNTLLVHYTKRFE